MKPPAVPTIVLQEEEWTDQPRLVDVTYPAKLVADFVNRLRQSKAWHRDVSLVHRWVVKLNAELAAERSRQPRTPTPKTAEQRKAIARANLAKARAARAANLERKKETAGAPDSQG